jgi:probable selenium-dependent hydroxylase accessory protein YqeC
LRPIDRKNPDFRLFLEPARSNFGVCNAKNQDFNQALSGWFETILAGGAERGNGKAALTVIGTGGKTSLIWLLASRLAQLPAALPAGGKRRILVTPATKMRIPAAEAFDRYCNGAPTAALPGVTLAGSWNAQSGKLESLAPPELERIAAEYDLVLIEGDGSRELPLKGWAEHEPVVPPCTTATVGIIPLGPLGQKASPDIIHRFPLFCALSGVRPGEPIQAAHLAAAISGWRQHGTQAPLRSLLSAARGTRILFFNQVEDEAACAALREVVSLLPQAFCSSLDYLIAGSVKHNALVWSASGYSFNSSCLPSTI